MSILEKFTILHALLIYSFIRLLSFLTWNHSFANQLIAAFLVAIFSYISVRKISLAWLILAAEFFLNGAGHFFELFGLLSRTWFLGIFGIVWLTQKVKQKNLVLRAGLSKHLKIGLAVAGAFILFSIINGLLNKHPKIFVAQDAILYLFFLLLFPSLEMRGYQEKLLSKIARGYLLGTALFSLIVFFIYSSGIGFLPDTFYHWFRNVAAGKITDLGNNFFRIVLPEHLWIAPAILIVASYLMKNPKSKTLWFYAFCASFVLVLNFTRIYFVGLALGLIILALKQNLKRWFLISAALVALFFVIFTLTNFTASRGRTFGLELLGFRISGVTAPKDDLSGAIRLALLPDILRTIKLHPWLGNGLGVTVSYTHPITKILESRTQFDWGYLEMLAELGVLGTAAYVVFLLFVLYSFSRLAYQDIAGQSNDLYQGLLAGGAALFVINITTPALFQGFGVLYFVFILLLISKWYNVNYDDKKQERTH